MERTAQRHCGQLKVIASDEPERVYLCHCRACQRRTGTAFHFFGATYAKERVRLDGERRVYERGSDSGNLIRFHFCPNCGTTLYWEGDRNPAFAVLQSAPSSRGRCFRRRAIDLGGSDAFLARPAGGHAALPARPGTGYVNGGFCHERAREQPLRDRPRQEPGQLRAIVADRLSAPIGRGLPAAQCRHRGNRRYSWREASNAAAGLPAAYTTTETGPSSKTKANQR